MTLSDRIERTVLLPVPRGRVWDAVTKPEQFARWFGVVSDMDFRVGGAIQFTWENERCAYPGVIEVIAPDHALGGARARDAPSGDQVPYPPKPSPFVEIADAQTAPEVV